MNSTKVKASKETQLFFCLRRLLSSTRFYRMKISHRENNITQFNEAVKLLTMYKAQCEKETERKTTKIDVRKQVPA